MLVGHYASAFAGKTLAPSAPLWSFVLASQALDVVWCGLVMTGVETARVDASLPGAPLSLDFMPYSHSLPTAIIWSVLFALAFGKLLKLPGKAATLLGVVVFSHWALDVIVHRPDLGLWFDQMKVGFGMWNIPVTEATFEAGLLGFAALFWAGLRARGGESVWPAAAFFGFLIATQIVTQISPLPESAQATAASTLGIYMLATLLAWLVERKPHAASRA